jgi:hypothetical protein
LVFSVLNEHGSKPACRRQAAALQMRWRHINGSVESSATNAVSSVLIGGIAVQKRG